MYSTHTNAYTHKKNGKIEEIQTVSKKTVFSRRHRNDICCHNGEEETLILCYWIISSVVIENNMEIMQKICIELPYNPTTPYYIVDRQIDKLKKLHQTDS